MSVPERNISNRTYRPDIDGIRAIAILSVVLYHAGVPWIHGGFTGVDIFFVISGYLIGGHIFAELLSGSFSFLQFYRRRAKRILPAFYVVLAFAILAALILLSPFEAVDFGRNAMAATLSVSNILLARDASNYFAGKSELNPLLMTWSLGVEEQFYAVIPLVMVMLARIRRSLLLPAIVAVCVLSFLYACYELGIHPQAVFYSLPARAWELGVGIALAVAELKRRRTLLSKPLAQWVGLTGLALMLAPMAMLTTASPFPGTAALPSVLGTALVIAAPAGWINRRLLAFPPLIFIGKISYSWYLWHWPILSFLRIISGGYLPPAAAALAIAASLGAAIVTYYFIEQPFRRSNLPAAPLLCRYAIVSLVALLACTVIWKSHGAPQRYPILAAIETQNSNADQIRVSDPCIIPWEKNDLNLSRTCYDSSDTRPVVALWGDSHAAALAPGVQSAISGQLYGFAEFSRSSCLPLIGATTRIPEAPNALASCFLFNRRVANLLNATSNIKVVILAGAWQGTISQDKDRWFLREPSLNQERPTLEEQRKLLADSLAATVHSLQAHGKQVIVMDDCPNFDQDPNWILSANQIPIRRALAEWMGVRDVRDSGFAPQSNPASAALVSSILRETMTAFPEAKLVDLKHTLCNQAGQCAYRKANQMLYVDTNHLSAEGARYALSDFHLPSVAAINGGL